MNWGGMKDTGLSNNLGRVLSSLCVVLAEDAVSSVSAFDDVSERQQSPPLLVLWDPGRLSVLSVDRISKPLGSGGGGGGGDVTVHEGGGGGGGEGVEVDVVGDAAEEVEVSAACVTGLIDLTSLSSL